MTRPDLSNLTPEQERVLCDAFRCIRQRAAWLRSQKEENSDEGGEEHTQIGAEGANMRTPMHT